GRVPAFLRTRAGQKSLRAAAPAGGVTDLVRSTLPHSSWRTNGAILIVGRALDLDIFSGRIRDEKILGRGAALHREFVFDGVEDLFALAVKRNLLAIEPGDANRIGAGHDTRRVFLGRVVHAILDLEDRHLPLTAAGDIGGERNPAGGHRFALERHLP